MRSRLSTLVTVAALVGASWVSVAGGGSPAAAEDIPTGIYFISTPSVPNACAGSQQADKPFLMPCDLSDARQKWEFSPSPSPGAPANYRQVRNVNYNMCLDAHDAGGDVKGPINLRDCNGSANQAWDFQGGNGGQGYVCNLKKGNCSMKLEHTPPTNPDPNHRTLYLADKYSHTRDWDIWYIWRPIVINPPNCQINPQSCA